MTSPFAKLTAGGSFISFSNILFRTRLKCRYTLIPIRGLPDSFTFLNIAAYCTMWDLSKKGGEKSARHVYYKLVKDT